MTIKIASRSSKLAIAQVEEFVQSCEISDYEIIKVKTEGDKKSAKGEMLFDKAHFVTDVQKYLIDGKADIAVHSAKDTPSIETPGISRNFLLPKSQKDVLIFNRDNKFEKSMKLGTSSLRRQLQAKHHLEASNVSNLSGNIDTRLEKLFKGEYDCIILAKAGLERLGLLNQLTYKDMNWATASGQGYLALEFKEKNSYSYDQKNNQFEDYFKSLLDHEVGSKIDTERLVLSNIGANCNSAISIKTNSQNEIFGEIYGINKYIYFSGQNEFEVIDSIKKQDGLYLLNEHN